MFGSLIAMCLIICMFVSKDPMYAIAAGLFEIAGVLHSITRPRRLNEKGGQ